MFLETSTNYVLQTKNKQKIRRGLKDIDIEVVKREKRKVILRLKYL
jgi:hypothetical protein